MLEVIKVMALQIAREIRCCPSPLASHGEEYQQHLKVCSSCRSKQSVVEDLTPWKELADSLKSEKHPNVEPRVGQIRFVNNELAGWGANKNFFQAPMVVILEENLGTNGYTVAQVYSDEALQGPDDVAFEELGGFAEPWNVYTLHKKHFGECLGEVSEELVVTIWNKFIDITFNGIVAELPASLSETEHDVFREFWSLEKLVSSHIANQSVALLMEERENVKVPNLVSEWIGQTLGKVRILLGDYISDVHPFIFPGETVMANAVPTEEHLFRINNDYEVAITYSMNCKSDELPAYIHIRWKGRFKAICSLCVLFIDPTTNIVLADKQLGVKPEGNIYFNENDLNFDIETTKWALSVYVSESND